jgi:hypothetical protein
MRPQVAVQLTTDATILEENYHRTPTALGHQLVDLLRAVTAPVALAAVAPWWFMATPVAEAAAAGAPHTGLEGEPVAEVIAEAEATQTATSPVSHAAAMMPAAESKKFDARNPPRIKDVALYDPQAYGPTPFSPRDSQGSCQSAEQGDYKRLIYLYTLATETLTMIKLEND